MESGQRNNHATFAFYFQIKLDVENEKKNNNKMLALEMSVRRVFIRKYWHFCWSLMANG